MGLIHEFKTFATKGNVMDLAVGVVIGTAFGKIIGSLVNDVVMPLINPLMPEGGWRSLVVGNNIMLGNFLAAVVDFIIIAFTIFLVVKGLNRFKKKEEIKPAEPSNQEKLLTEIRDLLKK
jgi:large conductance mechanosensitive channel